jgi:hypothetical protein
MSNKIILTHKEFKSYLRFAFKCGECGNKTPVSTLLKDLGGGLK